MIIQVPEEDKKTHPDEDTLPSSLRNGTAANGSEHPSVQGRQTELQPPPYEASSSAQHNSLNVPLSPRPSVFAPTVGTSHGSAFAPGPPPPSSPSLSASSLGSPPITSAASSRPPPSFSRQPPPNIPEPSFAPTYLIANGKYLDKGFPLLPPPSTSHPHPFITHDVNVEDWFRFLDDIKSAGSLTEKQKMQAFLPIISLVPIVSWLSSQAVKTYMKRQKVGPVADLIDGWNHYFFNPRKLDIVLMRGTEKLNNSRNMMPMPNMPPPDDSSMPPMGAPATPDPSAAAPEEKFSKGKEKEKEEKHDKILRLYVNPYFD
ncbi:hypothetical protein HGRIS_000215 [Hohenbuehelia grisea]|uniref:Uncharacterized protein n=1 Tax=Hohenbuehelia grisea TaxID=104357 RepID=A0ABR3JQD8_9AGAR